MLSRRLEGAPCDERVVTTRIPFDSGLELSTEMCGVTSIGSGRNEPCAAASECGCGCDRALDALHRGVASNEVVVKETLSPPIAHTPRSLRRPPMQLSRLATGGDTGGDARLTRVSQKAVVRTASKPVNAQTATR